MRHDFVIYPSATLQGELTIPADKSLSHRALLLASIAHGTSCLRNVLLSADCYATLHALQQCGIAINVQNNDVIVQGLTEWPRSVGVIDCGNSGTTMRLLAGLLAGKQVAATLTGDASLLRRPMQRIITPLSQMGAVIDHHNGLAPLTLQRGVQQGIDYVMPHASAQVKSCLLLAGLHVSGEVRVTQPHITRDHTERLLTQFGAQLQQDDNTISLHGPQQLTASNVTIPGDLSSAAFFIVAASITPGASILLRDVGVNPTRTGIITILQAMEANIELHNVRDVGSEPVADISVRYAHLRGITIPPALVPLAIDEFPAIFVACALAEGFSEIHGIGELRVKESDRIAAMAAGLRHLGCDIVCFEDGVRIKGGILRAARVDSVGDHRIAMAFAMLAGVIHEPMVIQDVANVVTSFPGFAAHARQIGLQLEELAC